MAGALAIALLVAPGTPRATNAAASPTLTSTVVRSGLQYTWDLAFTPDGQMLVTERPGRVRIYSSGAVGSSLVRTVTIPSVHAEGESGLMGIAVDVDYAANRLVYVCATRNVTASTWQNEVLRFTVAADGSWTNLVRLITGMTAGSNHDGCAVEMDPSGRLWVSMGDAGDAFSAQNPNDLNGKILRVNRDGTIPSDNPIMPGASGRSAVYSMGHRNPQGIAFQPGTGRVYAAEHGPNTDDEVNLIVAGGNYGWPCYTGAGSVNSADPSCGPAGSYRNPAWASGTPTLATSGLSFADGVSWGDFDGNLFVAQLKETDLRRFTPSVDGTTMTQAAVLFDGTWGRLRAVVRGPAGQLYLTTSNGTDDKVIRISVATPTATRLAGPDRYATAAAVSAATWTPGVPVAYVATGLNFPDALAGAAAAAHDGGPLLLVTPNGIPAATASELARLAPGSIRVLGGPSVVSDAVMAQLQGYTAGTVTRLSGADRYETAAAISAATFSPGVGAVALATGANFPDALAGGAAAAHYGGPVLLTRQGSIPQATLNELARLGPGRILVLGGPSVISNAVMASLDPYTGGPVLRLSGSDRYATGAAISAATWTRSDTIYVATGANFPDGLSGSAAAGALDVPVLLVRPTSVPIVVGQEILRLHPTHVVIVGGPGAVTDGTRAQLLSMLGAP